MLMFSEITRKTHAVLPAEVSEGAVGLSHLVHIVALANSGTLIGGSLFDFVGKSTGHGNTLTIAGVVDEPAHSQSLGTIGSNFQRNLVSKIGRAHV